MKTKYMIKPYNVALHGIGVKPRRDFGFRYFFCIHTLGSGARPPRELVRCSKIEATEILTATALLVAKA